MCAGLSHVSVGLIEITKCSRTNFSLFLVIYILVLTNGNSSIHLSVSILCWLTYIFKDNLFSLLYSISNTMKTTTVSVSIYILVHMTFINSFSILILASILGGSWFLLGIRYIFRTYVSETIFPFGI
jgi:hypothetical protein